MLKPRRGLQKKKKESENLSWGRVVHKMQSKICPLLLKAQFWESDLVATTQYFSNSLSNIYIYIYLYMCVYMIAIIIFNHFEIPNLPISHWLIFKIIWYFSSGIHHYYLQQNIKCFFFPTIILILITWISFYFLFLYSFYVLCFFF